MPIIGFEDVPSDMFQALEEAGHGRRLVIVDRSFPFDRQKQDVVGYRGRTSAQALHSVLRLCRREGVITAMAPDPSDKSELGSLALILFREATTNLGLALGDMQSLPRFGKDATDGVGFYDLVDDEEQRRPIVVRTPDPLPYACATFIVGHSQTGEEITSL
jgi:hypothetical protein